MDDKRIFLAVPYEQRAAARAAGARWDATLKVWYVSDGQQSKVSRWMPQASEPEIAPREEFIATMTAHGLLAIDRHPIADGRNHRVPVEGDKVSPQGRYARPSGRYALHLDGHPAGYVRNFRTGVYASWKSTGFKLPPHELAALRADIVEREKVHAAEQSAAIEAAARRAQQRTARLVPAREPTGYMLAKGIRPTLGALTDSIGETTFLPAIDIDGKQWTLQTIKSDGLKLFQKGSRKEGTFHIVDGDLPALDRLAALVMAEGYATAVIITDAIGQPTIAAFDAGNLLPVATALRERFPGRPILIAGDDDVGVQLSEGHNPGREKATAAAEAVDGLAVFPVFARGEQEASPRDFTDFHDLAVRSRIGRQGAQAQIQAAMAGILAGPGGASVEAHMPEEPRPSEKERRREPPAEIPIAPVEPAAEARDARSENPNSIAPERGHDDDDRRVERGEPSHEVGDVPGDISARYRIETGSRRHHDFYESHTAEQPAFRDRGNRLVSEIESAAVIADMIVIAEHRGWQSITVEGTNEFRREAWVRAHRAGLEVAGYTPTERDRQEATARSPSPRSGPVHARADDHAREQDKPRILLSVPFAEKENAKAAGARWDRDARSWYVEDGQQAAVARWIPDAEQARAENVIGRDRAAVEQLRTIEAVVSSTLSDDPSKAKRVLEAGRDALAAKVERGEAVQAPVLQDRNRDAEPSAEIGPPKVVARKPRERLR
ncbi:phage/plasmid primase-like uncharacterized protein [Sphingomonas vulcanisoli]|uniref:Phage/plasmid primase-like uncharacterized protein n=1 Tax=Sphingomonas vulcanisoli TaxID=1658060 RepID=A0ABX0TYQ7_9SPHN|nr:DUF5710 domain-containing protein [Sphingomonas vulcanisoli]NIJ09349.1 phage/plasmid primase-like uncharacterized protein [Sphingomonas vulcanisoli]